jgi:hypothetical protein
VLKRQHNDAENAMKTGTKVEILWNLTPLVGMDRARNRGTRPHQRLQEGPDGEFFSDIAKALPRYNRNMTHKQLMRARRTLPQ